MKEELIEKYLPLVKSIANRYKNCSVPMEDLIQEGCIGILEAFEKFDATKGAEFSTYAFYWIKRNILKALDEANKQSPNSINLNEEIDVGAYNYTFPQTDARSNPEIRKTIETFPEIERKVLTLVLGLDGKGVRDLNQISKILNLPKERVRQIREKAKRRLRNLNLKLTEPLYAVNIGIV
ncbi:sigma-70 family RNA polymerase sigma factor [candidate division WOR-3 bacterium]|nr:sigma-70 family RNA polymerase sigma factor [candidate division WOR-3 bacterium]